MHLLVIMHGMWGHSGHMNEIVKSIQSKYSSDNILIYNSNVNTFFYTFQGIDYCGYRLKESILNYIKEYENNNSNSNNNNNNNKIDSISFIGYSAGGLFNRYCVGLLYNEYFFNHIKPIHFITIATPHLGIRHNCRLSSGRLTNLIGDTIVPIYAGRTGCQMALVDGTTTENQLLLQMSLPNSPFIKGLKLFSHIYIYSNANNDHTVPFCTSSLSHKNTYKNTSINKNIQTPLTPSNHTSYSTPTTTNNNNDDNDNNSQTQQEDENENELETNPSLGSQSPLNKSPESINHLPKYKFIIKQERVDHDINLTQLPPSKKLEYNWFATFRLIFYIIIFFPLFLFHCFVLMLPIRLISLCFSYPKDISKHLLSRNIQQYDNSEINSKPINKDDCPLYILKNLSKLPIYRVVVYIDVIHSHGPIICRSRKNEGGMEVMRHLIDDVLSLNVLSNEYEKTLENNMIQ